MKIKILLLFIITLNLYLLSSQSYAKDPVKAPKLNENNDKPVKTQVDKIIRRLDLNLSGTNCSLCYLKVDMALNKTEGIYKAAIMMVKPYSAVIIYDPKKITMQKIIAFIISKKLKVSKLTDKKIDKIPTVLIPNDILYKG